MSPRRCRRGVGDIIGGTGLVVALGLSLGAMLHLSGAAASLAKGALQLTGKQAAPWATLGIAIIVGLPLFFETGLVLLLPIVVAAAEEMTGKDGAERDAAKLRLIMPALAGLGVVHALVPPHPGPPARGRGVGRQPRQDDALRHRDRHSDGDHLGAAAREVYDARRAAGSAGVA
ncbi:GntT/GntP/DsdX family permease [Sphingomonas sp. H160509]|uniref:GntT/GntP/DsdX family permease n=1 Tax=Sphingomonas sp. H160509 TaxID=2955313 RepID=UPI00315950FD